MGLERIFGDLDARPPTYLIHFKSTFHVDKYSVLPTPFSETRIIALEGTYDQKSVQWSARLRKKIILMKIIDYDEKIKI